jgi:predicted ATPase
MTTREPDQRAEMAARRDSPPRRFILTGAPGAGKTAVARELAGRGWAVVPEAATDVIATAQAHGIDEPWEQADFLDTILRLQQQRASEPTGETAVQLFDRSPICTLALARYAMRPVATALADEVARIVDQSVYQRDVFFFQALGFVVPTPARRISYADSLRFDAIHREVYQELGFRLLEIGVDTVARRADLVEAHLHLAVQRVPLRG